MAEEKCNNDCEHCSESSSCSERNSNGPKIEKLKVAEGVQIKHIIGVLSGKGGVGKSFVSSYLAVLLARKGYRVGVLDADITGPSQVYSFGIKSKAYGDANGLILPAMTDKYHIQVISSNMLLDNDTDPILWRGPMIGQMVGQFYTQVKWEYIDFLIVDMPPGTGDAPLTIFQQLPIDGIVIATTPQSLVSMIVEKGAKMAGMMNIPVVGLVSNMSYVKCPKCGEKIMIYGEDHVKELCDKYGIPVSASVPFDSSIAKSMDAGAIEELNVDYLDALVDSIAEMEPQK